MRFLWPETEPSVVIHTMPHVPWRRQKFYAIRNQLQKLWRKRLNYEIFQKSRTIVGCPYRNENGIWPFVNNVLPFIGVAIRDFDMTPFGRWISGRFCGDIQLLCPSTVGAGTINFSSINGLAISWHLWRLLALSGLHYFKNGPILLPIINKQW